MKKRPSKELQAFADAYRGDEDLRNETRADPVRVFKEHGFPADGLPPRDFEVVANTREVVHFVLPPNPNSILTDDELRDLAGGRSSGGWGLGMPYFP